MSKNNNFTHLTKKLPTFDDEKNFPAKGGEKTTSPARGVKKTTLPNPNIHAPPWISNGASLKKGEIIERGIEANEE